MTGSFPPGSNRTSTANCGSPGELLPPEELQNWVGGGGAAVFKATGAEFLSYLVDLCGLQPGGAVLDVGCGSGRVALPLTGYLNREGRYAGFDVSREAIAWCTENISGSHPNFDFRVVDIQTGRYNPKGKYKASDFRFPYPDGSFDVVLLASVFTHMLPPDVEQYMDEIVRVLKPGGRSLITFFLLNEESSALSKEGKGFFKFEHEMQGARTMYVENPEAAIAYPEAFVRDLYRKCGLELQEPVRYGTWCGRPNGMSGQDVVIAVKAVSRNRLAQGVPIVDIERPQGSTKHPRIPLSDENIAFAEAMGVNPAIHENDFIFHFLDRLRAARNERERAVKDYFNLGRYNADLTKSMITDVQKIYEALKWDWVPSRVLDFASGYGCTARHMRHVFADSICGTCDIHLDAVNFNKDVLGVESYISSPVPQQLKLPPQDVIFAHSFFSHMPETTWAQWLKALADALAPRGVLIFTTYGFALDKWGHPGLNVKANGFGFIPQSERNHLDTAEYGLTISYPRWVLSVLASMPELRLSKFHEGLWWGMHGTQDTYVCVKEPEPLPGSPPSASSHPTAPVSGASKRMPRMSPAAAEEYIASLYATVLKRDPKPGEFANWVATAVASPPEQVYFAFVNSKEYKLQQEKSVPTMFRPGHFHSPIVDPSTIAEYVEKQYLQEPDDIKGIHLDEDAMVRFWKENAECIKNTPFSEHDDGKNRYYYNNIYPYGDAIMLRAMIAHFKPKNVIEVGSGFSSACILDTVDHVGLSDFTMTCIDPNADRLRSRLREEDRSRVDIIEGLVQDVPISTFSKLTENDILFIDSTHVLKTASDVHYELFSILPSLNKGVLVHFHDIQYPFEYPRQWLFDDNYSWNEIYALRAFLMYNSAFEVVFWNGLFAHRQRELVHETNRLFLKNPGGSIWLRARSVNILQTQHSQIGVMNAPQVTTPMTSEFIRGLRPNLAISDGDTMYKAAAARHYEFVGRSDLSVILNALNLRAAYPGGDAAISDIFDFGCGHGRAARWFRAAFPEAAIWVTDLDQAGVDWCVKQFGCKDTGGEIPADRFDVVWLGSVFTHLPRHIAEGLIDNLLKSLKPNGLLIFTTQGRFAVRRLEESLAASDVPGWMHYNLERDSVEDLIRQFNEGGYGYVDYPRQKDYGVCVAKSHWYSDRILKRDRYIQILVQEKGSDNHQDVLAFMRTDLGDRRKGPLY